jgi:hypothetical protein
LIQVVVVLLALGLGVYFLTSRLERQKNVTLTSNTIIQVHMGLQSIMDYVYYTVQRRYCLTDTLLQADKCQLALGLPTGLTSRYSGPKPDPQSARSIERILLSNQQADNMVQMVNTSCVDLGLEAPYKPRPADASKTMNASNCAPGTIDNSFQRYVSKMDIITSAADINAAHPLFAVIDPLYRAMRHDLSTDAKGNPTGKTTPIFIHVRIERDTNVSVPKSGNEVYFTVTVSLQDQNGTLLSINNGTLPLRTSSYGTMFPREMGVFSLVVANNLWLDGTVGPPSDVSIVPRTNWNPAASKGMLFMSPVFVNGDIHLPYVAPAQGGFHNGGNVLYAPVTFGDRVIQGNGSIYAGATTPYVPQSAGGTGDSLWSDNMLFGGFKLGVAVDNAYDKGLQMLATGGISTSNFGAMQKCLAYQNAQVDPIAVGASQLYAGFSSPIVVTPAGQAIEYTFGIVDPTKVAAGQSAMAFNMQATPNGVPSSGTGVPFASTVQNALPANNAVMGIKILLGDPAKGIPQEADAHMGWGSTLTVKPYFGSDANPTPAYTNLITRAAAETAPDHAWKDALTAYTAASAAPGSITVKLETVTLPELASPSKTDIQSHLVKMTVTVSGINTFYDQNFVSSDPAAPGTLAMPIIDVVGYDSRYNNGGIASLDPARILQTEVNTHRRIVFTTTDGASLNPPADSGNATLLGPNIVSGSWSSPATYIDPYASSPPYDNFNYIEFVANCQAGSGSGTSQSFGAAAWNIDFSSDPAAVRHAWNFANNDGTNSFGTQTSGPAVKPKVGDGMCPQCGGKDPCPLPDDDTTTIRYAMCSKVFSGTDSFYDPVAHPYLPGNGPPPNRGNFQPWSIVKDCDVKSDASLVAGFITCESLTIEDRSTPLLMIGTFIVKNLTVADSALKHGVTWMSIYNPNALSPLRLSGILRTKTGSGLACTDFITQAPIWDQQSPTVPLLQDMSSCNALYLRATAQPFQWTAFDPDCGIVPNVLPVPTRPVCKYHPVNYFVMEQGRGGGP